MGTYTNLPRVIGHRTGGDPENTVLGMRAALPYTSMIEVDVRFTSDDRMVLGHDGTLDRMTNCTGAIEGKTWAAVSKCKIDSTATRLNLLGELFRAAPGKVVFLIELKGRADATQLTLAASEKRKLWVAIRKHDVADRVIVASFSTDAIKDLKASRPPAGVRYALNDSGSLVSPAKAKSVAGFYVVKWDLVTRRQVAAYRDAGLYVCLYTPNSSADLRSAINLHANGIITDEVKRLRDMKVALRRERRRPVLTDALP